MPDPILGPGGIAVPDLSQPTFQWGSDDKEIQNKYMEGKRE